MTSLKNTKIFLLLRDTVIVAVAGLLLLIVLELLIRIVCPQTSETRYTNNMSLGLKDSILGHVNRPNAHTIQKGPEFEVEYKIDSNGLRDETVHLSSTPEGVTRILLLGDSFTFGAGNDYEKIWPVVFEQNLKREGFDVDVVKAGVSAYDTRKEALYLERLFPQYKPDIVVFAFLPNDLFTNSPIEGNQSSDSKDIAVQVLGDKNSALHLVLLAKRLLMLNDRMYTKLYMSSVRKEFYVLPMNNKLKEQIKITQQLLLRGKQYCQANGAEFVILSIPQLFQVIVRSNDFDLENVDVNYIDSLFTGFAEAHGIHWVPTLAELAEKYKFHEDDLYFRFDGHLNNLGNTVVGDYFSTIFAQTFMSRLDAREESTKNN